MLAIFVSLAILVYFILPGILFRLVFSFSIPLRSFDRSRTLEISYAFVTCLIPLTLALTITYCTCWVSPWADHRTFLTALVSDQAMNKLGDRFWLVAQRSIAHQVHTIVWHYCLLVTGSIVLGVLARHYGDLVDRRWYSWFAEKILLPNVSEWHVLLTDFGLNRKDRKNNIGVIVDVLTSDDHLYTGLVGSYALDREGHLTGIQLTRVRRFDRKGYLEAKAKAPDTKANASEHWREIPGNNMFLFASSISNMNVRYTREADILRNAVQELLARPG